MRCAPAASDSRRQPTLRGEAFHCSWGVLPLNVKAGEIVAGFDGRFARKGAHDDVGNYVMQELGLAVNALSSARLAATLMLERSPHKLDTHHFKVQTGSLSNNSFDPAH